MKGAIQCTIIQWIILCPRKLHNFHELKFLQKNIGQSLVFVCVLFAQAIWSQSTNISIRGRITEKEGRLPISGAAVILAAQDSLQWLVSVQSDSIGEFVMNTTARGKLTLITMMTGYFSDTIAFQLSDTSLNLDIELIGSPTLLNQVNISETMSRMEIRGDTIQFNAAAYQVHPDATAEDLLVKMPGMTIEGNTVKSNGEEIKKVIVDGKPFFGDDPSATLKSIPADMIENVQVFDKQTDQADFGGYKDNNAEKTINIKTKKDRNNGKFGKLYAGYGTDNRYQAGFALNHFNDDQRISILGMTNNINQQNFSPQDLADAGGRGGRGGRAQNFILNQPGIAVTNAIGINYNDNWGSKTTLSASYNYTETSIDKNTNTVRNYFSDDKQKYDETNVASNVNRSHRANLKLEYKADSLNRLTWNFRMASQDAIATSTISGLTHFWPYESPSIQLKNNNNTTSGAKNFVTNLLYQHRFKKLKRTISLDINTQWNMREGNGEYQSESQFFDIQDSLADIHQQYESLTLSAAIYPTLSYTEPIGDSSMVVFNIKPSFQENSTSRLTDDLILNIDNYANLSNKYEFQYNKMAGNVSYQYYTKKRELTLGIEAEESTLQGVQTFPLSNTTNRKFLNLLPRLQYVRRFANTSSFNFNISAYTISPTSSQLQEVLDISNPLFITGGNPRLLQSKTSSADLKFNKKSSSNEVHYMFNLNISGTSDYIGNSTSILSRDTVLQDVMVSKGSQVSTYQNLNGNYSGRISGNCGFPLSKLKLNVNLNASFYYSKVPAMMNSVTYFTENHISNGSISFSSNISKNVDFTLTGSLVMNEAHNELNPSNDNQFFTKTLTAKLNWILLESIVFNTDLNLNNYKGLSQSNQSQIVFWNAGLGYKFGKEKPFELKITGYDLLKQNVSLNRTVNSTFTEDTRTQTLQRYWMISLTYSFKKYNKKEASETSNPHK